MNQNVALSPATEVRLNLCTYMKWRLRGPMLAIDNFERSWSPGLCRRMWCAYI